MNAPAQVAPYPAAWRAYGPSLDAVMPGKAGEERRIRCGLMLLRDRATKARDLAGWEANNVLYAVKQIAGEWAFQPAPIEHLRELHYNLLRLVATASNLETLAPGKAPDANG